MDNTTPFLFVYSSLRRGFRNDAYNYLSDNFDFIGEAHVRGRLLDNGQYPVGVPTDEDFFIEGELYQLKPHVPLDFIFEQLDDYEGINSFEDDVVPVYRRGEVTANHAGRNYPAYIYWYTGDVSGFAPLNESNVLEYFKRKNRP